MERILERTKAKQEAKLAMPVTFGAIDPLFAPKDPLANAEEQSEGNFKSTIHLFDEKIWTISTFFFFSFLFCFLVDYS